MALVKVYTLPRNKVALVEGVAKDIKAVVARALDTPEVPTDESSVETVYCEGIDLIGIDYILEIIAVERPNLQGIADEIIGGLNDMHPDVKFSVYFNLISVVGMAHTLRE
jgi:hypothetical protein